MSPWHPPRRWASGFTLVELLVVVLIIGVLAAIALPRFLGQRTRTKNAAAQAAVRHALVAARSYYTQNSESYSGLGPSELRGYESSLSGTEAADGQQPGASGANPQDIWIGNGATAANPVAGDVNNGKTVILCSVSRGDTTYCIKDADGVASYLYAKDVAPGNASGQTYSSAGWLSGVSALTAANGHTCALMLNGTVRCWDTNTYGQLGDGTTTDRSSPAPVSGLSGVVAVSARENQTCALLQAGTVWCWGKNDVGQLGDGTTTSSSVPVRVSGLSNVKAMSTGGFHGCAVMQDGTVQCWGNNGHGQLGNNTFTASLTPTPVSGITSANGAVAIAAGTYHSCALLADASVKCWGQNAYGQAGDGATTTVKTAAVTVTGGFRAIGITAGYSHSCALIQGGTIKCWGRNEWGILGDGSETGHSTCLSVDCSMTPLTVTGISNAVSVSAGVYHTCATLADGTARCWGSTWGATPVAVSGVSGAINAAAGGSHSCGVLDSRTVVRCWGSSWIYTVASSWG